MFKLFNNNCPTYLRERFHRTSELIYDYNLRASNYDLQLPLPETNFLKRSFSYRGLMTWNQLSSKTRDQMGDLTSFKLAISQDILRNFLLCFYLISLMTHFLLLYCISNYYYFYFIYFFTTIISLDYHINQMVTFMTVDRNR